MLTQEIKKGDKMNNDTQFLASGHSLKKISSKISSLQATKESVGVLGIAFGKKSLEEILIKILLTQEIKKGDRMKKDKWFLASGQRFFSKIST